MSETRSAVIVGGGMAGLAAALFLRRSGFNVTLFEKRRHLGGRAVTHLRHGFRFNLGPHALYRRGASARVLGELGVPIRGGVPNTPGIATLGTERFRLPATPISLLFTRLFNTKQKIAASKLLLRIRN